MDASRLVIEQIIELITRHAAALLADDGRKCAIDTMLAATALAAPEPLTFPTSNLEDLVTLCSGNVTIIEA